MNREFKRLLKHTWKVFFGRYGKLTEIQKKAIPIILKKKNAIIVSRTASGKTEAVIAPLVELLLKEKWNGLSILYISPTRALVNDMYERLSEQLEIFDVSVAYKTGDKPTFFKPKKPTDVLITTPESFDSLICRAPKIFENIRAVILDEIHLMYGLHRGDQLQILLNRLRKITNNPFNVYLLSATIAEPEKVAKRYTEGAYVIFDNKNKQIQYTLVKNIEEAYDIIKNENLKKVLMFLNKRMTVEYYGNYCKKIWDPYHVVVHHGSLSKKIREEAEEFMKTSSYGICIATTTLEIGIDIGDIDVIILGELPNNVSTMLQRIGRGNRRNTISRVIAIYSSDEEKKQYQEMFELAKKFSIEQKSYNPDYSVVVQQIFSILFANPNGVNLYYLIDIFNDFCPIDYLNKILKKLLIDGYILYRNEKYFASEFIMDLGSSGYIHSNIHSNRGVKIFDAKTQEFIGTTAKIPDDFIYSGETWKVVGTEEGKIYAKRTKNKGVTTTFRNYPQFGKFFKYLPKEIQEEMKSRLKILNKKQKEKH